MGLERGKEHSAPLMFSAELRLVWRVVYGFGGLCMIGGKLRVSPKRPEAWKLLRCHFCWQRQQIRVEAAGDRLTLVNETGRAPVELEIRGKTCVLADKITVEK